MNFTEYQFDKNEIKALVKERSENLLLNRGEADFLKFGLGVIAARLKADQQRYRDYGPYWYALKSALNRAGYEMGSHTDTRIETAYCGESDEETLVMADEFRTHYLKTQIVYTNQFVLDGESGEAWTLFDEEMEMSI